MQPMIMTACVLANNDAPDDIVCVSAYLSEDDLFLSAMKNEVYRTAIMDLLYR